MDMDRINNQEDASRPSIEPPSSPPPFLAPPVLRRKRTRGPDTSSTPSSDGPIFSSDPPDPSVDEYFQPRRKRQYRGTWWGETTREDAPTEPAPQRTKNTFSRNMDSGIWMGSDVTDEDFGSDGTAPDVELPRGDVGRVSMLSRKATQPFTARILPRESFNSVPARPNAIEPLPSLETAQDKEAARTIELAHSKLQHFLDNSEENIGLCSIGLKKLPIDFFEPLQTLFRDPSPFDPDNTDGETEVEFQARIRLDLSNNALEILPLSLFGLQNITILNLSHNNLTQLPRHIGKLKNLASLNINSNRLRWLPWELIELRNLCVIYLDCNPLLQPFSYVSSFGSSDQLWLPPTNVGDALRKIRDALKHWRHLRNAKSQAALQDRDKSPDFDETPYNHAIEHAEWRARFYINCVVQSFPSDARDLSWKDDQLQMIHIASTPVVRFGVDGRLLHAQTGRAPSSLSLDEFVLPAAFEQDRITRIMEELEREDVAAEGLDLQALTAIFQEPGSLQQHATLREGRTVPSLFELALQSATKGSTGEDFKYDIKDLLGMIRDTDPESFRQGLQTAVDVHEEGGRVCSVCSRPFIIARTEWVEYWHLGRSPSLDKTKMFIPILRRGCSQNCVAN